MTIFIHYLIRLQNSGAAEKGIAKVKLATMREQIERF